MIVVGIARPAVIDAHESASHEESAILLGLRDGCPWEDAMACVRAPGRSPEQMAW